MSGRELKRFAILADLGEEELELLEDLLEPLELGRGQPLVREGSEGDGLVLVDAGALRLETAQEGVLGRCEAGGAFGALALAVPGPRAVTAVAEEPSQVRVLSRPAFHRLCEDAPRTACRLLEAVLREVALVLRGALPLLRG